MPLKRDTKKNPYFISSTKLFLKDILQDNHWVGHSVMKPVVAVLFHKIISMGEGNNYESDNFEMDILDEGALDKALKVSENIYMKNGDNLLCR